MEPGRWSRVAASAAAVEAGNAGGGTGGAGAMKAGDGGCGCGGGGMMSLGGIQSDTVGACWRGGGGGRGKLLVMHSRGFDRKKGK